MKILKYKIFLESNNYKLITWSNNHNTTGCIIDSDNNIITEIDNIYDKFGNLSDKITEFNIKGKLLGADKDMYMLNSDDINSSDDAIEKYKLEIDDLEDIEDYITPEREHELVNLFRNKN